MQSVLLLQSSQFPATTVDLFHLLRRIAKKGLETVFTEVLGDKVAAPEAGKLPGFREPRANGCSQGCACECDLNKIKVFNGDLKQGAPIIQEAYYSNLGILMGLISLGSLFGVASRVLAQQ